MSTVQIETAAIETGVETEDEDDTVATVEIVIHDLTTFTTFLREHENMVKGGVTSSSDPRTSVYVPKNDDTMRLIREYVENLDGYTLLPECVPTFHKDMEWSLWGGRIHCTVSFYVGGVDALCMENYFLLDTVGIEGEDEGEDEDEDACGF